MASLARNLKKKSFEKAKRLFIIKQCKIKFQDPHPLSICKISLYIFHVLTRHGTSLNVDFSPYFSIGLF